MHFIFSRKNFSIPAREIPLWFWTLGFLDFLWNTAGPGGIPVGLISGLGLLGISFFSVQSCKDRWREEWKGKLETFRSLFKKSPLVALALLGCAACLGAMLSMSLLSALRPPFLSQEYDAINYQMGIPRQLLVRKSLAWIEWSTADLWPMILQYGMSPLSNAFFTINKIPQFFFALGLMACLYRIPKQLGFIGMVSLIPLLAVMGSHGVMIQMGTGMMDLPLLYLLLLSVSALLDRRYRIAAFSLSIFIASKSFNLFLAAPLVLGGMAWALFGKSKIPARHLFKDFLPVLLLSTCLLLSRSALLSFRATGTPLFPFFSCQIAKGSLCEGESLKLLRNVEKELISTRDKYGNGRSPRAFFTHLWRVAIPTKGVNNEFDYPLGLPWLLFIVLVGFTFTSGLPRSPLLWASLLLWALWWMNAQQSRWLYPTLALGFLGTLNLQRKRSERAHV